MSERISCEFGTVGLCKELALYKIIISYADGREIEKCICAAHFKRYLHANHDAELEFHWKVLNGDDNG